MPVFGKSAVLMVSGLLLGAETRGVLADSANPYQGIVDRNTFALKPLPPPGKIEDAFKKPDPPKILITGMTDILGSKRVLLNVQMPAKPSEPAKQQNFIIAEGQREGEIEVLNVDLKAGTVKLNNFGSEMTLSMEKDGAKLPATAAAPVPGVPPPANTAGFAPAQPGAGNPLNSGLAGLQPLPGRKLRVSTGDQSGLANNNVNLAQGAPVHLSVNGTTLGLNFGQQPQQFHQQAPPQQATPPPLTAEEQAIHMLAQHVENESQGITMPPLPPPLAEVLKEPSSGPPSPPHP